MKNWKYKFLVTILASATSLFASFDVVPFILKINVDKGQTSGWLEVKPNQDKRPVAVQLTVQERKLDINGIEQLDSPESNDLAVYPSELVIFPGERKKVQVVWAGTALPNADKAYSILAEEIPIDLNERDAPDRVEIGIKTLVRYRLIVALETGRRGSLSVVSSKSLNSDSVEIVVENKGGGRIPMDGFHLLINGKKYSQMQSQANAIMPGDRRRFVIPLTKAPSQTEIRFGAADGPAR